MFLVQHRDGETTIPVHEVKSICLSKSVQVSTNALFAAIENNIDVLLTERGGYPVARLWNNKFGATATTRQNQIIFMQSEESLKWVIQVLVKKIENQNTVLLSLYQYESCVLKLVDEAIAKLESYLEKVKSVSTAGDRQVLLSTLRGWEGNCSKHYFKCISSHLPEIYRFQKRSQHPANDFFNAALNYAYGILYSQVEGALIKAGVDPFIGILHEPVHNKPVLVYDVFENFRYWADYVVINLCMQQVMFPEFFIKDDDAVLLEEDGKRILIQSFNDYMNEVVEIAGMERSRLVQIENYAFKLGDQINKTAN